MNKLRSIAIHLPQFHPVPENDEWWGKGFTEWTNVAKAKPLFKDHYQPHLPADLGFYDLRLAQAREAQANMAKEYGLYGFCYYHYWFNGKRILERPVQEILQSGKPDFPFMLCWANENWTRRWDGGDETVLLKQDYSHEDDLNHIRELIPYFKDSRYIRINNKPVFAVYKSSLLPNMKQTTAVWREEAARHGLELYLCKFETLNNLSKKPSEDGFDAAVEFQPSYGIFTRYVKEVLLPRKAKEWNYRLKYRYYKYTGQQQKINQLKETGNWRIDYSEFVDFIKTHYRYPQDYTRFPGVVPCWDNTARRGADACLFYNNTPQKFKEWFQFHYQNFKPASTEENFIFINAWNEWAEGNHLEPCQRWGRSYLEAIKETIQLNDSRIITEAENLEVVHS